MTTKNGTDFWAAGVRLRAADAGLEQLIAGMTAMLDDDAANYGNRRAMGKRLMEAQRARELVQRALPVFDTGIPTAVRR